MKPAILIIVTSHAQLGPGPTAEPTGLWLEELAIPYRVLTEAGAEVTIASPLGGPAPIDPRSAADKNPEVRAFLADPVAQAKVKATKRVAELAGEFDAVFVAGGHGTMWDLPGSKDVAHAIERVARRGGVVAAVCHGPAALIGVKRDDGKPLVAGRRVAAFSNEEERAVKLDELVPFLLESKLVELGGLYERGPMWKPFVVTDRKLVTGQNPASSRGVAEAVWAALQTP